VYRIWLAMNNP